MLSNSIATSHRPLQIIMMGTQCPKFVSWRRWCTYIRVTCAGARCFLVYCHYYDVTTPFFKPLHSFSDTLCFIFMVGSHMHAPCLMTVGSRVTMVDQSFILIDVAVALPSWEEWSSQFSMPWQHPGKRPYPPGWPWQTWQTLVFKGNMIQSTIHWDDGLQFQC